MAAGHDAQAAGERVEALLAELRSQAGPQVARHRRRTGGLPGRAVRRRAGRDRQDPRRGRRGRAAAAGPSWSRTRWWRACCWCMTCTRSIAGTRVQRAIDAGPAPARRARGPGRVPRPRRGGRRPPAPGAQRPWLRVHGGHDPGGHRAGGGRRRRRSGGRRLRGGRGRWPSCRCCRSRRRPAGPGVPGDRCRGIGDRATGSAAVRQAAGRPGAGPAAGHPADPGRAGSRPGGRDDGADAEAERCEMCREVLDATRHGHVVDTGEAVARLHLPRLLPALHPRGRGGGRYRAVPERVHHDPDRPLTDADWNELQIPVAMAFFFFNSDAGPGGGGLPEPGRGDRVRARPRGLGPAGRRPPAAGRAGARRRGHLREPDRRPATRSS